MRLSLLPAFALLCLTATAIPTTFASPGKRSYNATCLCQSDAQKVANNFKDLINLPFNTTLAKTSMTAGFQDYTDSVSELINKGCSGPKTLGDATFDSRENFIKGQGGQPPIPFQILNLWHTCDTVIMRWRTSTPGSVQPERLVTGIVVLETTPNPQSATDQPFLIETSYSEFNSGAWLSDVGIFTPQCS